ncbi:hypothetical protein EIN_091970 [Entamoeba invadens IP1]|uniref:Uncharacterized protein n=1 Tax=Entamoeba invadens IP1 TaxID=370355 RepID=A0A0A1U1X2_ENTIV|nr:hypothetical protein EIN_091970 [Entamoeba invadens IP1]ELP86632.1 hypothetical protein EIN_091970 [Entamoeba invadens IP1]|eukprot:XP_004185978.1 hypothetical protein EIN_091970 [Entamoeba invadens IP1]
MWQATPACKVLSYPFKNFDAVFSTTSSSQVNDSEIVSDSLSLKAVVTPSTLFEVKKIPRVLKGRSTIQINSYQVHFLEKDPPLNYSLVTSPTITVSQFIVQMVTKINKETSLNLNVNPETYQILVSDDLGVPDEDLPPLEFSSKIGEIGTTHFAVKDNHEYLKSLKKTPRRLSLLKDTYKVFFNVRGAEKMSVAFQCDGSTTVNQFISIITAERNRRLHLTGDRSLSSNPEDYQFRVSDSMGGIDSDIPIPSGSVRVSGLGKSFVLTGMGRLSPEKVLHPIPLLKVRMTNGNVSEMNSPNLEKSRDRSPEKADFLNPKRKSLTHFKTHFSRENTPREDKERKHVKGTNVWMNKERMNFDISGEKDLSELISLAFVCFKKKNETMKNAEMTNYVVLVGNADGTPNLNFPTLPIKGCLKELEFQDYLIVSKTDCLFLFEAIQKKEKVCSREVLKRNVETLRMFSLIQIGTKVKRKAMIVTKEKTTISEDLRKKRKTFSSRKIVNFKTSAIVFLKINDIVFAIRDGKDELQFCSACVNEIAETIEYAKSM